MTQTYASSSSSVNSSAFRILAWIGIALQAIALAFVLWSQKWGGAWVIAGFLSLSLLFMLMQDRLPSLISFVVVLASLCNAGGWAWEWYSQFVWFDEFIHTFTSFAVMAAISHFAWTRGWNNFESGSGRFILWAAAVGLGLGILWEICESFFLSLTWWDTIVDLVVDTIGAALGGWFAGWVISRQGAAHRP